MSVKVGIIGAGSRSEDAVHAICDAYSLNCSYISYAGEDFGTVLENGTGTGMMGAVQRGEFDTFQPTFTPTYARALGIDFTQPLFYIDLIIATKTPMAKTGGLDFKIATAFKWDVWCLFLASLLVTSEFMILLARCMAKKSKYFDQEGLKSHWALSIVEQWSSLITHKHQQSLLNFQFIRMVVGWWSLSAMVIASAYTSSLFSDKLKNQQPVPYTDFDSMLECMEDGRCHMVTHSITASHMQILTSTDNPLGQRLVATFKKNPLLEAPSAKIPEMLLSYDKAILVWLAPRTLLDRSVTHHIECQFYVIDGPFPDIWSFPLRKGSPLTEILNRGAAAFLERGLAKAVSAKYDKDWSFCTTINEVKFVSTTLKAAFIFYGVGVSCCLLAYFVEEIFWYWESGKWLGEII